MSYIQKPLKVYTAIFLVAASTLALEITLSRILSVITYYYLAFASISIAMLGITAGAVTVFIKKSWFEDRINEKLLLASIFFAVSFPSTMLAFQYIPVVVDDFFMRFISLFSIIFFCSIPFYFSGIIITAALTKLSLPVNKLYASDLAGAATGCILVVVGLEWLDAPSLIIISGLPALISAYLFSNKYKGFHLTGVIVFLFLIISFLSFTNLFSGNVIRPAAVKGKRESPDHFVFEKWNSFSRVTVDKPVLSPPQYWGPSPLAPYDKKYLQYKMTIDGDAGTVLRQFSHPADLQHLEYDLVNFAYFLQPKGNTCIIGAGAGKDIQAAIHFGHKKITGIDINPVFIHLLQGRFKRIANVANHPAVRLIKDDARSFLSRDTSQYDLIQMSLVDTWAATGAGAFSLSENNLYTVEAWNTFFKRLNTSGVLTVSRWYNGTNLGETGRLVSLAVETLFRLGKKKPSDHIALLTVNNLSTIIVSNSPLSTHAKQMIREKSHVLQFNLVALPGIKPSNEKLAKIMTAGSSGELKRTIENEDLNYTAPTDENPYFFNMLRLRRLQSIDLQFNGGIMTGNLQASISLLILIACLGFFSVATCFLPLILKKPTNKTSPVFSMKLTGAALYFALIGCGFILTEMGFLHRLSVFFGQPVYALAVVLSGIILSSGIGSYLNGFVKLNRRSTIYFFAFGTTLLILLANALLKMMTIYMINESVSVKILLSLIVIFPVGIFLGQFFPVGMRLVRNGSDKNLPWYLAINGIFGVLFSAIAIFISVYAGISYNFYFAAFCYSMLVFSIWLISKQK